MQQVATDYERVRQQHAQSRAQDKFIPIAAARANAFKTDWTKVEFISPIKPGVTAMRDFPLNDIVPFIDWTPFFHSWELKGSYPRILDDAEKGTEARKLFADAQAMLKQMVDEKWIKAHAVVGLWPANSDGDDIIAYTDIARTRELCRLHTVRQQTQKPVGMPNIALSDFVAPKGYQDHVGGFVVTCGDGVDDRVALFERDHDDYSAIMLKALADRLAEAFAELMHLKVRKEIWGYSKDEQFSGEDLIAEKYRGIRPAPGYPAQPDHTEKATLFEILQATEHTGVKLTESLAMYPTAAVCGLYLSHPESTYFGTGKIDLDQLESYAQRKAWDMDAAKKWLGPILV